MSRMCGECRELDPNTLQCGQFKCQKDKCMKFADSLEAESCRNWWARPFYDSDISRKCISESKKYKEAHKGYTSVGCYVTTAVVNILGIKDDCPMLETLRFLRGYYMQNDPQYRELLLKYDTLGPVIAIALFHDENRESVAQDICIYLQKVQQLTAHGEIEKAIAIYVDMTEALTRKYVLSYTIGEEIDRRYDQANGGHGSIALKSKEPKSI